MSGGAYAVSRETGRERDSNPGELRLRNSEGRDLDSEVHSIHDDGESAHIVDASPSRHDYTPQREYIQITPWMVIHGLVLFSVGLAKSIATFTGQTSASNNLDFTLGVFWTLLAHCFSIMEKSPPRKLRWLLRYDLNKNNRLLGRITVLFIIQTIGILTVCLLCAFVSQ
ncbi:hypothetical protein CPC08DRAFT_95739 [Agrocybe pediades]|nr:hypothetical protein CPC08DRAFT_95739 [Agrocybe pediades]